MFQDLDLTLKAILGDLKAPAELFDADVSFVVPDRDYKPGTPTVNLFLHGVKENREPREGDGYRRHCKADWPHRTAAGQSS